MFDGLTRDTYPELVLGAAQAQVRDEELRERDAARRASRRAARRAARRVRLARWLLGDSGQTDIAE